MTIEKAITVGEAREGDTIRVGGQLIPCDEVKPIGKNTVELVTRGPHKDVHRTRWATDKRAVLVSTAKETA